MEGHVRRKPTRRSSVDAARAAPDNARRKNTTNAFIISNQCLDNGNVTPNLYVAPHRFMFSDARVCLSQETMCKQRALQNRAGIGVSVLRETKVGCDSDQLMTWAIGTAFVSGDFSILN